MHKTIKRKRMLDSVDNPRDLKKIFLEKLPELCDEVRDFTIESVSKTGGHFGSNLGVVELTVALHYVFDTPKDLLVWDVGHQTYPHKILTGRKNKLRTIRQKDGLAPFPKRQESKYDAFDVGHSSTSISVATGMAIANGKQKGRKQIVTIIGDGALGGGMAMEALNHAGDIGTDMLVILNDNRMSISPNVGAVNKYLTRLTTSRKYNKLRQKGKKILGKTPKIKELTRRLEEYAKGMISPGTLFEEMGFGYYGPIDGHNVIDLVKTLNRLKKIKGPKLLHITTIKGKGYKPAEDDEFCQHATTPFDLVVGCGQCPSKKVKKTLTYTRVFSDWITTKGREDTKLHAITPAMCSGSGLEKFAKKFPKRFHDVGIAEQHAVTLAGGLAVAGRKPVVAIYSSFLQRAYDQLIHDVALQNLNVLFAVDRAGIVGPDGATHAGSFDLSFLRPIPNLVIMAPANESECYAMLEAGYCHNGPAIVRYPRGGELGRYKAKDKKEKIKIGQGKILREMKKEISGNEIKNRNRVAILVFGSLVERCHKIAEDLNTSLVNMRFVKPLDEKLLKNLAENHNIFITVEDNGVAGGAGSAVNEFVLNNDLSIKVKNIGLPDKFLPHGSREEILEMAGLDEAGILKQIKNFI